MNTRGALSIQRGFTFVELMMTLAIMGVLALVSVPMAQLVAHRQKEHDLRVALVEIRAAIDAYKRASEQGRILLKVGESGYPPSLDVLVDGVVDQRSPTSQRLYFLRRLPRDPFAPSDDRRAFGGWGLRSYASSPDNPQEGADVYDVYSKSEQLGMNGVPHKSW